MLNTWGGLNSASATVEQPVNAASGVLELPALKFAVSATVEQPVNVASGVLELPALKFAVSATVEQPVVNTDYTIVIDISSKKLQNNRSTYTIKV